MLFTFDCYTDTQGIAVHSTSTVLGAIVVIYMAREIGFGDVVNCCNTRVRIECLRILVVRPGAVFDRSGDLDVLRHCVLRVGKHVCLAMRQLYACYVKNTTHQMNAWTFT